MINWLDEIKWNDAGLVPAIAQDAQTNENLMVAWMNREALKETVETNKAVYWSRSRKKMWRKGEESGHQQIVKEVRLDCDADVIVLKIEQKGGADKAAFIECILMGNGKPLSRFLKTLRIFTNS